MTYYRVEFLDSPGMVARVKRFRTPEGARKHAIRVLGSLGESGPESRVAIVAVSKGKTSDQQPSEGGTG